MSTKAPPTPEQRESTVPDSTQPARSPGILGLHPEELSHFLFQFLGQPGQQEPCGAWEHP